MWTRLEDKIFVIRPKAAGMFVNVVISRGDRSSPSFLQRLISLHLQLLTSIKDCT